MTIVVSMEYCENAVRGVFTSLERVQYLQRYGIYSMSSATLQPNMEYFDVPGLGYIAYAKQWGRVYVLYNPVCDPVDLEQILTDFYRTFPYAVYIQVSRKVVDILHNKFGLYGTQIGLETCVNVPDWSLKGRKKKVIRKAVNVAKKEGVIFLESPIPHAQTQQVSESLDQNTEMQKQQRSFSNLSANFTNPGRQQILLRIPK